MAGFFKSLLPRKARAEFRRLERRLIAEVESKLDPAARELFQKQVDSINLVQRHGDSKEICCYPVRFGIVKRNPELRFPNHELELKLASVRFRAPDSPAAVRADFYVVLEARIHSDPMRAISPEDASRRRVAVKLNGWVAELARQYEFKQPRPPLSPSARKRRLVEIEAALPADYLELVEQAEGLEIGDCVIQGLSFVREVVLDEANYYVLAELDGEGVLAVRRQAGDGEVYQLDFDHAVIGEFATFREAVEAYLERRR
jgi:hypothetical protein